MNCPNCNTQNQAYAKFCRQCGATLQQKTQPLSAKTKQKKRGRLPFYIALPFLFVCLCLALVAVLYFSLGLNRHHQVAHIIPQENTVAFASFSPSLLQLAQVTNLETISQSPIVFAPLALLPGVTETLPSLLNQFPDELEIDFTTDVLPWVGHEVSLAVVNHSPESNEQKTSQNRLTSDNNNDLLLSIITRDAERSDVFLQNLRQPLENNGFVFAQEVYQEIPIFYVTSPESASWAYTTTESLVWLATSKESLHLIIDNSINQKQTPLWDDPSFQTILDQLPANRLGYVYLPSWQPSLYIPGNQIAEIPLLPSITNLGIAMTLIGEGVRFDYATQIDESKLSFDQRDWLRLSTTEDALINQAPNNCLLYFSSKNISLSWEALASSWLQEKLNNLEEYSSTNIERNIFALFDNQYAGIVTQDRAGFISTGSNFIDALPIGFGLLAEIEDDLQAGNDLDEVLLALDETSRYQAYRDTMGRESVWYVGYPNRNVWGGFVLIEDTLIAGSSENTLQLMTRGQHLTLADHSLFQMTRQLLPDTYQTFVYVDVAEGVRILDEILDEITNDEFSTQWRPYLARVQTVGVVAEPMDEDGLVTGVVVVVMR